MKFLKDYRCTNCNKLFFKGEIKLGEIEIKCKNCKEFSVIKGKNCRLQMFLDRKAGDLSLKNLNQNDIQRVLIECDKCEDKADCQNFHKLHNSTCPICRKKLDR